MKSGDGYGHEARFVNSLTSNVTEHRHGHRNLSLSPIIFTSLLFIHLIFPGNAFSDDKLSFSGYYKNLFVASKTTSASERYFLDTQRLRLELDGKPTDELSFHLAYDNNVLLNDFSHTPDFDLIRQQNQKDVTWLDADKTLSDRKHVYWKHGLYRAFLKYTNDQFHATIGKQAIDWSRMRFYHCLDLFSPISPLDIEKDEKTGIDALNFEYFPSPVSGIQFIYAPNQNLGKTSFGLKASRKLGDYDLALYTAYHRKDSIIGFSFDGYVKGAGLRGEMSATRQDDNRRYIRSSIGMDYNLSPKIYVLGEYFYNGGAKKDPAEFLNSFDFSRRTLSIYKHILSTGVEYALTGIAKLASYFFYDCQKKSFFYNPEIRYNITSNIDFSCGSQFFWGDKSKSEFGVYKNLYYTQLKWYF